MSTPSAGALIVAAGVTLVLIGLLVWSGGLSWFGRLPGDIVVKRDNFTFYFPVVTSILLSVVLTLVMWLFQRR